MWIVHHFQRNDLEQMETLSMRSSDFVYYSYVDSTQSYCWFSVSRHSRQIKIKIKTVQQIKSGIWKMKGGKYTKTLAKSQVRRIFRIEISEEMFYPNLQRFVWRRHAGAHLDGHQHGGRKPTTTSVTEFWYKSVNLFLEELINIKVILFLIHELFRQQNSPKYVTFLNYMTALSAVM